jgi:hypothetical protein
MDMAELSGRIFKVNDQLALVPILLGDIPPLFGYAAWPGATVTVTCYMQLGILAEIELSFSTITAGDGSFSLSVDLPDPLQSLPVTVAITVSFGVPVYRSGQVPLDTVSSGKLNFWIFPDQLPPADGITAGSISSQLSGSSSSLPSDTTLTTTAAGLDVSFSSELDLVDAWFGIGAQPDTSPNLQNFVDLSLRYCTIIDLLPWPIQPTGAQVFQEIQDGIAAAAGSLNSKVLTMMEDDLEKQDGVSAGAAQNFFTRDVSVIFTNITFVNHTWNITATDDSTVVMNATICIGFPRNPTPGEPVL